MPSNSEREQCPQPWCPSNATRERELVDRDYAVVECVNCNTSIDIIRNVDTENEQSGGEQA